MAPLLRQLVAEYAATGLPPAYLPKDGVAVTDTDTTANTDDEEKDR
jgi:hypothetical protein